MPGQDLNRVDDSALLERMRRGDESAFAALYERLQGPIYRYAMHMCGRSAADDVVQDTFLALIHQGRGFDPRRGSLSPYIFGIARHCILKRLAERGVRLTDCESGDAGVASPPDGQPSPLAQLERAESIARVREAVATLPPVYREVVVLCELQEMDYVDAAAVLECPIGTVRSRLHRGRALLMQKLTPVKEMVSVQR